MFHQVFIYFGISEDVVSDRSHQFTSHLKGFLDKLGARVSLTSGYQPQLNGQVIWVSQKVIPLHILCGEPNPLATGQILLNNSL